MAEWARALTGDRTVNVSSPAAVKTFRFASELWQFRLLVIPVQRQCHVMSLVVGIQGQKAYGLCKTPLCAELVVQFSP